MHTNICPVVRAKTELKYATYLYRKAEGIYYRTGNRVAFDAAVAKVAEITNAANKVIREATEK